MPYPPPPPFPPPSCPQVSHVAGVSKRGHIPSKPGWKNQDSIGIAYDDDSGAMLLIVCDGHGPSGEKASARVRDTLEQELFKDPAFCAGDTAAGLRNVIATAHLRLVGPDIVQWEADAIKAAELAKANYVADTESAGSKASRKASGLFSRMAAGSGRIRKGSKTAVPPVQPKAAPLPPSLGEFDRAGTTLTCAVVRGEKLTVANVRVSHLEGGASQ